MCKTLGSTLSKEVIIAMETLKKKNFFKWYTKYLSQNVPQKEETDKATLFSQVKLSTF
jgi:hypothetical protein